MLATLLSREVVITVTILFWAAAAVGGLAWFEIARRRTTFSRFQFFLFLLNSVITRGLWGAQISHPLPLKTGEGGIVVSNHTGSIDPFFFYLTTNRMVHWMVAREYCENPMLSWFFRVTESIPVNRAGVDTAATKMAIRLVKKGEVVGMFPEGRINLTKDFLLPGRPGAAMIALKARVPIIPCYLRGVPYDGSMLGCFTMFARTRVIVGDPIYLDQYFSRADEKQAAEEITLILLKEIARLGGNDDFEPRIAGRRWRTDEAFLPA